MSDDNDLNNLLDEATAPAESPDTDSDTFRENAGENAFTVREGHAWAADCYWAYEHLGDRVTRAKAGTAARFAQWKMAAKDPEYFVMQVMPKAMTMLEKARDKAGDEDGVSRAEQKSIAELQRILTAAIAEAGETRG